MAAYIVSTVRILDADRYAQYAQAIAGLGEKHGGEPVLRGEVTEWLEGAAVEGQRVVVSRFPSADAARGYIRSAEYQAARRLREGAVEVDMRLVES